jgi:hypothetical protein
MTAIWGPLGWMTLHSVSHNYPEHPSSSEKQLAGQWIELFRDTITCSTCGAHFTELLETYKTMYPQYLNSRTEFILFAYRAHNTVNRKLDKPIYHRVEECEEVYSRNIRSRSGREYRNAYISHIRRNWSTMQDMNGISRLRKVAQLAHIEQEYWAPRESTVTTLRGLSASPLPEKVKPIEHIIRARPLKMAFIGGRLRFQK